MLFHTFKQVGLYQSCNFSMIHPITRLGHIKDNPDSSGFPGKYKLNTLQVLAITQIHKPQRTYYPYFDPS